MKKERLYLTTRLMMGLLVLLTTTTAWADDSGNCGASGHEADVTWYFNESGKTLTISGTGDMADYENNSAMPWYQYKYKFTSVVIEEGVTHIGNNAFNYFDEDFASVTIPASVISIGENAFRECLHLADVIFAANSSLTTIGDYAFRKCYKLKNITIPASVKTLGRGAFQECSYMEIFNFASGSQLQTIGKSAFESCDELKSIEIPASVSSIGSFAFNNCMAIEKVIVYAKTVPTLSNEGSLNGSSRAFHYWDGLLPNVKIYVFGDVRNSYQTAKNWDEYADIINPIADLTVNDAGGELGSWCTYYNGLANIAVAEGTTIYKAVYNDGSNEMEVTPIAGNIIKSGQAVLLKSATAITLSSAASEGTGDYSGNELLGVDAATPQAPGTTYYVMSKMEPNGFGFYQLETETELSAHKAYLAIPSTLGARKFIGFSDNSATGISAMSHSQDILHNDVFDLQGRHVAQPQKKGIYVVNGKKIVVK